MEEFSQKWFDESSAEWMKNKRKLKTGMTVYICEFVRKNGVRCKKNVQYMSNHSCDMHYFKMLDGTMDVE